MNHFPIVATLDRGRAQEGTVSIDRGAGLFVVRPKRRRRTYTLPLALVASIVVSKICSAEAAEARRAKGSRRPRVRR
jgi:hypothetical protein